MRVGTTLTDEDAEWFQAEAARRGVSTSELLRHLIGAARRAQSPGCMMRFGERTATADKKLAFLLALEELFNVLPACRASRVAPSTVYKWAQEDQEFALAMSGARQHRLDEAEELLWDLATGRRNGNVTAVLALLNAYHPAYGRIRGDVLRRVLQPFLENVRGAVHQLLPQAAAEALERALEQIACTAVRKAG